MSNPPPRSVIEAPTGWPEPPPPAEDIVELLPQLHRLRGSGWLFRGEPKPFATHRSSLGRRVPLEAVAIDGYASNEASLINLFRSRAWPHLRHTDMTFTTGVLGWLVLMQHHGAPTRLLDWTWSHWVAAYHAACRDAEDDGYIWAFRSDALYQSLSPEEREAGRRLLAAERLDEWKSATLAAPEFVISAEIVERTDRMVAQQGSYTICNPPWADHCELLGKCVAKDNLRLLRVPRTLKSDLMQVLSEMNLTGASLYPGLDGAGRRTAEAMDWGQTIARADLGG